MNFCIFVENIFARDFVMKKEIIEVIIIVIIISVRIFMVG